MGKSNHLIPEIQRTRLRLFTLFTRWYVKRSFHSIRVFRPPAPEVRLPDSAGNIVLYSNHPSWWDPLIGLVMVDKFFDQYRWYAPIASTMLNQYAFFRHLGFYGVHPQDVGSVRRFLQTTQAILSQKGSLIWVTPQGRFTDPRCRHIPLESGLSRMSSPHSQTTFIPVALEYPFWEERLPEVLVHFGSPIREPHPQSPQEFHILQQKLQSALTCVQDELATFAISRNHDGCSHVEKREPGFFIIYDLWRTMLGWLKGQPPVRSHHSESSMPPDA
jgi:1-acyl-sn-glycerol-3-phosphate acyltransferase